MRATRLPPHVQRAREHRADGARAARARRPRLVIDDGSPDGTGDIADALAGELDGVSVLHRPRQGRSRPRYLAGFHRALADGAELILEMDCDFSHDPADVPRLLAAAEEPTSSSAHATSRAAGRRTGAPCGASSRAAGRCTRRCCSACPCATSPAASSATAARCSRRLPLDEIHSKGYAFQIETTYRTLRKGFRVRESRSRSSTAPRADRR